MIDPIILPPQPESKLAKDPSDENASQDAKHNLERRVPEALGTAG